jgi:solute carrier family 25 protein 38
MTGLDILAGTSPVVKAFLAGSMSGTCSTIMFQPLDVVKTRLQLHGSLSSTMTGEARIVITTQGVPGLWTGLRASLCRTVPGVGLYFASMHWMRNSVCEGKPSPLQSFLIGGTARTVAGAIMIPFTVVKTRVESGTFHYRSVTNALVSILSNEGVRGLTRGLGPTLARSRFVGHSNRNRWNTRLTIPLS